MAQRTGAERLLTSLAKAASTRLVLVLAAAVLLGLAGCGSGSDSQTTASAKSEAAAQNSSSNNGDEQGKSASEEEQAKAAAKIQTSEGGEGGGKHGPSVASPKGEQEPGITPQQREEATVADISFFSPDLPKTESVPILPTTYTCDGKDSWPAFDWSGIPGGTEELALFMMNTQPVGEKIFFDWAVAGLDPNSGGIEAGALPADAVMGTNSFGHSGYSVCPSKGKAETFMLVLYALPKGLDLKQGFDPLTLREEAEDKSGNAGLMAVSYAR